MAHRKPNQPTYTTHYAQPLTSSLKSPLARSSPMYSGLGGVRLDTVNPRRFLTPSSVSHPPPIYTHKHPPSHTYSPTHPCPHSHPGSTIGRGHRGCGSWRCATIVWWVHEKGGRRVNVCRILARNRRGKLGDCPPPSKIPMMTMRGAVGGGGYPGHTQKKQ